MNVTETLSDGLKRAYVVRLAAADLAEKTEARLVSLGKDMKLPGFRPGKVPMSLVKQRYGQAVTQEIREQSISDAADRVLQDRGLRPSGQPTMALEAAEGDDIAFRVELEVLPEITVPPLADIALTRPRAEASPESIDKALGELTKRMKTLAEPQDGARPDGARPGDVVTVDFTGSIDGTEFAGGKGEAVDIEVGGQGFVPGFTEGLAGIRPGETRDVAASFPEDYQSKDVAGKAAVFKVACAALRVPVIPEADDAMAEKLGVEGGIAAVREVISGQIQREYDQLSRMRVKRQLLDALAERADFPAPGNMVEAEFGQIWSRVEADRKAGRPDAEDADKDDDALRADYRGIAERRVRLGLLLSEIGRLNGITVAQDEMLRAIRAEASRYQGQEQQVLDFFRKNPQAAEGLRGPIFEDKVVDYILELAQVTDETVTPEALAEAANGEGAVGDAQAGGAAAGEAAAGEAANTPG